MPMSNPVNHREIHHRTIDIKAFARDDGLYDVLAHLVDRKPFPFLRIDPYNPIPAGQPLHDFWIRITVDDGYVVRAIEAASDTTPFELCKEAETTLSVLVGARIASGWSSKVKSLLRGAASCTHLMEMLITMATPALQGIRGLAREHKVLMDSNAVTGKLDSCYAYSSHRAVIKMHWPEHYKPSKPSESNG